LTWINSRPPVLRGADLKNPVLGLYIYGAGDAFGASADLDSWPAAEAPAMDWAEG
jgi:hypothetical protein